MTDRQPLAEGEHVDLDSGVTVRRGDDTNGNKYRIRQETVLGGPTVGLDRDDIRVIAELAGFEVTDP